MVVNWSVCQAAVTFRPLLSVLSHREGQTSTAPAPGTLPAQYSSSSRSNAADLIFRGVRVTEQASERRRHGSGAVRQQIGSRRSH